METIKDVATMNPEVQALVKLSDLQIETIQQTIAQAEKLVFTVLERDVDYGLHPGTDSMALKDSGGSKIANAFSCYAEHVLLHITDDEDTISYVVQTNLIHRGTGRVVASGIGACSTMESKYAWRWVQEPPGDLDKTTLKFKKSKGYRIPNPDIEDLGNTILKMASKRSEVDAAQSLPGVGSALVKLFQGKKRKLSEEGPNWTKFWGEIAALKLTEDNVHEMLGIKSLKDDWLAKGKSLNQAVEVLTQKLVEIGAKPVLVKPEEEEKTPWEDLTGKKEVKEESKKITRDPLTIKDIPGLLRACFEDFKLQPPDVYKELGYTSAQEITDKPSECYLRIKAVRI